MKLLGQMNNYIRSLICFALLIVVALNLTACSTSVQADDLAKNITANNVKGKETDEKFVNNTANFSIELFKKSFIDNKSTLISPLSVLIALSMTANGAEGETLTQMEKVLGGDIPIDQLNEYLYTYSNSLPSEKKSKLNIANSIWFRDNKDSLTVEKEFLQKNSDYYKAAAYKSVFDKQTVKDINNWVRKNTDNMIDSIIDDIDDETVMFLINAVVFDARWENVYMKNDIHKGNFTSIDKSVQNVDFMRSNESKYIKDSKATGFIKPYANGKYSFVALLPNEGTDIKDYVATLTGESFLDIIKPSEQTQVNAYLPKFTYDYSIKLNDVLKALGMPKPFSSDAEFSKLGKSNGGNIFISDVLHKTFISVDELGTKAGAAIKVEMTKSAATPAEKTVKLDRPFVYAIIDNETNLPVFVGTVMSIK